MRRFLSAVLCILTSAILSLPAPAQDSNIVLPVELIERGLGRETFDILNRQDTRFEGDRTQRVTLAFGDTSAMVVKWARAPRGGAFFNNQPRYEVAAYLLQKMFLAEPDYVVPPTVVRSVPVEWYRAFDAEVAPTFDGTGSVLVALQYWLNNVSQRDVYSRERLDRDTLYARHFGNLNVLTYLIRHGDSNDGNVLVSTDPANPRLFVVDNGVAFAPPDSDRGTEWRNLKVRRIPRSTVEGLRALTRADLDRELGVVAQFAIRDGELIPVPPTAKLSGRRGVRRRDDIIQFGLTDGEIRRVHTRMVRLLRMVDSGRIDTF